MTGLVSVHTLVTLLFLPEYTPTKVGDGLSFYVVISTLYLLFSMLVHFQLFYSTPEIFHPGSPPVSNTLVTMMQLFSFLYLFPIRYRVGLRARGTGLVGAPADPWE